MEVTITDKNPFNFGKNSGFIRESGIYICMGCKESDEPSDQINPNKISVGSSEIAAHQHRRCSFCKDKFTVITNSDGTGLRVSRGWI